MFSELSVVVAGATEGMVECSKLAEVEEGEFTAGVESTKVPSLYVQRMVSLRDGAHSAGSTDSHVEENRLDCEVDGHFWFAFLRSKEKRKHKASQNDCE